MEELTTDELRGHAQDIDEIETDAATDKLHTYINIGGLDPERAKEQLREEMHRDARADQIEDELNTIFDENEVSVSAISDGYTVRIKTVESIDPDTIKEHGYEIKSISGVLPDGHSPIVQLTIQD